MEAWEEALQLVNPLYRIAEHLRNKVRAARDNWYSQAYTRFLRNLTYSTEDALIMCRADTMRLPFYAGLCSFGRCKPGADPSFFLGANIYDLQSRQMPELNSVDEDQQFPVCMSILPGRAPPTTEDFEWAALHNLRILQTSSNFQSLRISGFRL